MDAQRSVARRRTTVTTLASVPTPSGMMLEDFCPKVRCKQSPRNILRLYDDPKFSQSFPSFHGRLNPSISTTSTVGHAQVVTTRRRTVAATYGALAKYSNAGLLGCHSRPSHGVVLRTMPSTARRPAVRDEEIASVLRSLDDQRRAGRGDGIDVGDIAAMATALGRSSTTSGHRSRPPIFATSSTRTCGPASSGRTADVRLGGIRRQEDHASRPAVRSADQGRRHIGCERRPGLRRTSRGSRCQRRPSRIGRRRPPRR